MLPTIHENMQATIGSSKLEINQQELAQHFEDEAMSVKLINEVNQKISYQKVLQSRVRGEVNEALKLFGRSSDEVALKTKELEEIDKQILGYSVKVDTIKQK